MNKRLALCVAIAIATPALAKPKLPICAPKHAQLFVSPMGEPFRAAPDAAYPVAAWFAGADADHDRMVTLKEFVTDADRFFATLDTDHDGEIIPSELSRYELKIVPETQLYAPSIEGGKARRDADKALRKTVKNGQLAYGAPIGAGRYAFTNVPEPVAAADADYNRGITRIEFEQAAAARFAALDGGRPLTLARLPRTPSQPSGAPCVQP